MASDLDWGDGDYARTALILAPTAEVVLDAVALAPGERLLDIACGTGNATLAAAGRGAHAVGVDAAAGLIAIARERAAETDREAAFVVGDAVALPVPNASFDAVVSVFGMIFAPDPERAAAETLRCLRPGGRLALTSWIPAGPISAAGRLLWTTVFPDSGGDPPRWGEADWACAMLAAHGARDLASEERTLSFTADSPTAWFAEQEAHHPAWRWARRQLDADQWDRLRAESVALLEAGNEAPAGFLTTSRYLVITGRR